MPKYELRPGQLVTSRWLGQNSEYWPAIIVPDTFCTGRELRMMKYRPESIILFWYGEQYHNFSLGNRNKVTIATKELFKEKIEKKAKVLKNDLRAAYADAIENPTLDDIEKKILPSLLSFNDRPISKKHPDLSNGNRKTSQRGVVEPAEDRKATIPGKKAKTVTKRKHGESNEPKSKADQNQESVKHSPHKRNKLHIKTDNAEPSCAQELGYKEHHDTVTPLVGHADVSDSYESQEEITLADRSKGIIQRRKKTHKKSPKGNGGNTSYRSTDIFAEIVAMAESRRKKHLQKQHNLTAASNQEQFSIRVSKLTRICGCIHVESTNEYFKPNQIPRLAGCIKYIRAQRVSMPGFEILDKLITESLNSLLEIPNSEISKRYRIKEQAKALLEYIRNTNTPEIG